MENPNVLVFIESALFSVKVGFITSGLYSIVGIFDGDLVTICIELNVDEEHATRSDDAIAFPRF